MDRKSCTLGSSSSLVALRFFSLFIVPTYWRSFGTIKYAIAAQISMMTQKKRQVMAPMATNTRLIIRITMAVIDKVFAN